MLENVIYCPLISQLSPKEQNIWVDNLNKRFKMVNHKNFVKVVRDDELTIEQKQQCEFAIVANPIPSDLSVYSNLKWIQSLWAGVEKLVEELSSFSFHIVRLIDPTLSQIMSEAVLAWSLYLHRQMPAYLAQQKDCLWKQLPHVLPNERNICVLGLGELGRLSTEVLCQHGFNVSGWSQSEKLINGVQCFYGDVGLDKAIANADIVVCLLPLTVNTHCLVNQDFILKMKRGSSLINFARGGIVKHDDLIEALDNGRIEHAVLDVFDTEPLEAKSCLWQHNKITVLPHISAPTHMKSAVNIVVNNINDYLNTGKIAKAIDNVKGY